HVKNRFPHKTVRHVRNSLRPRNIATLLQGMPLSFQRAAAGKLDATYHFVFTGREQVEATVVIRNRTLAIERGLHGEPNIKVTADTDAWLGSLAKERNLLWALLTRKIRVKGNPKWPRAFQRCFPS